jgi:transaldolase
MEGTYDQATATFSALKALGIGLDDVFKVLEAEGVEKFEQAWDALRQPVEELATKKYASAAPTRNGVGAAGQTID